MAPPLPILIIGAGISGLTTARLLTNSGIPNIVFEASSPDRSQGFAISLREWGYATLLSALGDLPLRSLTRGVAPDREIGGSGWIDQVVWDNGTAKKLFVPDANSPTKKEVVRANRNALRRWIADCGEEELDVRYGHRLKRVEGSLGNVRVEFENGSFYRGLMVVAADGVNSTVRSQVLPDVHPETMPAVLYHGEFQMPRVDFDRLFRPHTGESNILAGVGDGFNAPFAVCNMTKTHVHMDWSYSRPAWSSREDDPLYRPNRASENAKQIPRALVEELASRDLAKPWSLFLNGDAIQHHRVFHWAVRCVSVTREDMQRAVGRGVVFVGDSWHAMPIFGGEGGNHALADGVELAAAVAAGVGGDLGVAIGSYYDRAWKRSQDAVRRSKQRFYALHRPMAQWRELSQKKPV
ncbi:probable FAD-dependent monooxygenase [Aspergillus lentulus]|uniref:FAD-dependent monooxygenase nscC n=1 Tax=Aspergillus lentulus TaxID=293939 RepID=A0AAN4T996_ASPLE|nr:probable FAD-dependent monooxygenase [Aspergillus lentulus]